MNILILSKMDCFSGFDKKILIAPVFGPDCVTCEKYQSVKFLKQGTKIKLKLIRQNFFPFDFLVFIEIFDTSELASVVLWFVQSRRT